MTRRALVLVLARFVVAVVFYGAAAVLWRALGGASAGPPLWTVLLATVVLAWVLWLLSDPIDRLANRVAFGEQADGVGVLSDLLHRLSDSLPVEEVLPRLARAIARDRPRAEVRVLLADGSRWSQVWPAQAPHGDSSLSIDVVHGGAPVGEIEVDVAEEGVTAFDRKLLDELAGPAGIALSMVRLTVELQRRQAQLTEVNERLVESTARIRTAREAQQRRIRAELAARVLPHIDDAGRACAGSDGVGAQRAAQSALDELRRLARGIYPPRLHEDGVAASLEGWLQRTGRTARVVAPARWPRLQDDMAACLYFCLVNLVDTLPPGEVRVDLGVDEEVRFAVDGVPEPDAVQLVRDRLETFDGRLEQTSDGVRGSVPLRRPADEPALLP